MIINIVAMFFCTQSVLTISSRMIMSFARDRGLAQVSPYVSPINAHLNVPFMSLVFVTTWVVIFALICESPPLSLWISGWKEGGI